MPSTSGLFLGMTLVLCILLSLLGLRKPVSGRLQWDGERWHWSGTEDGTVTELVCVMDLQRCVLVRMVCDQTPTHWLWLETCAVDSRWQALRRAIVAGQAVADRDDLDGFAG